MTFSNYIGAAHVCKFLTVTLSFIIHKKNKKHLRYTFMQLINLLWMLDNSIKIFIFLYTFMKTKLKM